MARGVVYVTGYSISKQSVGFFYVNATDGKSLGSLPQPKNSYSSSITFPLAMSGNVAAFGMSQGFGYSVAYSMWYVANTNPATSGMYAYVTSLGIYDAKNASIGFSSVMRSSGVPQNTTATSPYFGTPFPYFMSAPATILPPPAGMPNAGPTILTTSTYSLVRDAAPPIKERIWLQALTFDTTHLSAGLSQLWSVVFERDSVCKDYPSMLSGSCGVGSRASAGSEVTMSSKGEVLVCTGSSVAAIGICPAGSMCPLNGPALPTPCPAGTASATPGSFACGTCPAGSFSSATGRVSCTDSSASPCPKGTYCPAGSVAPTRCPPGTYNTLVGSTSATACVACSDSPLNLLTGAVSASACLLCESASCPNSPSTGVSPYAGPAVMGVALDWYMYINWDHFLGMTYLNRSVYASSLYPSYAAYPPGVSQLSIQPQPQGQGYTNWAAWPNWYTPIADINTIPEVDLVRAQAFVAGGAALYSLSTIDGSVIWKTDLRCLVTAAAPVMVHRPGASRSAFVPPPPPPPPPLPSPWSGADMCASPRAITLQPGADFAFTTTAAHTYGPGLNCNISFTAPQGYAVKISFSTVSVGFGDSFLVWDGLSQFSNRLAGYALLPDAQNTALSPYHDPYPLGRGYALFLGNTGASPQNFTSASSAVALQFVSSTASFGARGDSYFAAGYSGVQGTASVVMPSPSVLSLGSAGLAATQYVSLGSPLTVATNTPGTLYVPGALYQTRFQAPTGYVIKISFVAFDTIANTDFLRVFDGASNASQTIAALSGAGFPAAATNAWIEDAYSTGVAAMVQFSSDRASAGRTGVIFSVSASLPPVRFCRPTFGPASAMIPLAAGASVLLTTNAFGAYVHCNATIVPPANCFLNITVLGDSTSSAALLQSNIISLAEGTPPPSAGTLTGTPPWSNAFFLDYSLEPRGNGTFVGVARGAGSFTYPTAAGTPFVVALGGYCSDTGPIGANDDYAYFEDGAEWGTCGGGRGYSFLVTAVPLPPPDALAKSGVDMCLGGAFTLNPSDRPLLFTTNKLSEYVNSASCAVSFAAPAGYLVRVSFLKIDLENGHKHGKIEVTTP